MSSVVESTMIVSAIDISDRDGSSASLYCHSDAVRN